METVFGCRIRQSVFLSGKEEMCMKKILLVAGVLASVSAAVFCVLRRHRKHYGSPC